MRLWRPCFPWCQLYFQAVFAPGGRMAATFPGLKSPRSPLCKKQSKLISLPKTSTKASLLFYWLELGQCAHSWAFLFVQGNAVQCNARPRPRLLGWLVVSDKKNTITWRKVRPPRSFAWRLLPLQPLGYSVGGWWGEVRWIPEWSFRLLLGRRKGGMEAG